MLPQVLSNSDRTHSHQSDSGGKVDSPKVFMSHNHRDKPFVRRLAQDLRNGGVFVWVDEAELKIGDSLLQKIGDAINDVDYLAIVLSSNSVSSEWVRREVEIALTDEIHSKKLRVLPILLEHCDIPPFLRGKYYADFTSESGYDYWLHRLFDQLDINLLEKNHPGHEYISFEHDLFQEALRHIHPMNENEWRNAQAFHSSASSYVVGDWLLECLIPADRNFWTHRSPTACERMDLLARIVRAMQRKSWRAELVRDRLIEQSHERFEYDFEYNDLVRLRERTIFKALQIIDDEASRDALRARWPSGTHF